MVGAHNVTDIRPIASMESLEDLSIESDFIRSLDVTKGLPLHRLCVENCSELDDITAILDWDLSHLEGEETVFVELINCPKITKQMVSEVQRVAGIRIYKP